MYRYDPSSKCTDTDLNSQAALAAIRDDEGMLAQMLAASATVLVCDADSDAALAAGGASWSGANASGGWAHMSRSRDGLVAAAAARSTFPRRACPTLIV